MNPITLIIPFARKEKKVEFPNRAAAQTFVNDQFGYCRITKLQWSNLTDALSEPMTAGMSTLTPMTDDQGNLKAVLMTP